MIMWERKIYKVNTEDVIIIKLVFKKLVGLFLSQENEVYNLRNVNSQ